MLLPWDRVFFPHGQKEIPPMLGDPAAGGGAVKLDEVIRRCGFTFLRVYLGDE